MCVCGCAGSESFAGGRGGEKQRGRRPRRLLEARSFSSPRDGKERSRYSPAPPGKGGTARRGNLHRDSWQRAARPSSRGRGELSSSVDAGVRRQKVQRSLTRGGTTGGRTCGVRSAGKFGRRSGLPRFRGRCEPRGAKGCRGKTRGRTPSQPRIRGRPHRPRTWGPLRREGPGGGGRVLCMERGRTSCSRNSWYAERGAVLPPYPAILESGTKRIVFIVIGG